MNIMPKNKTVLVTGAAGFIGSHLAEFYVARGFKVIAFDRYNSNNHWGWLENSKYKNDMEVILGDVRDYDSVSKVVAKCNLVFHLAALVGIPYSYISPLAYIRTNVEGTYNVLEACRNYGVERVIVTSTSEVYGTAQYVPIDEEHPKQPQSPYSATKIAADALADSFYRSFRLPVVIARPFNTYGPRQSARAIIPTIITQLLNKHEEIYLGSLEPSRDFNYVEDVCRGFFELAQSNDALGREVNIGSGCEVTIKELAQMIISQINPGVRIVLDKQRQRPDESEVQRLLCDNRLIKKFTAWRPEVQLKQGLIKTIEWFKEEKNLNIYKAGIYNV